MGTFHKTRFNHDALVATIEHGGTGAPGCLHPRQARPLLQLDTPEQRERAFNEAHTLQNLRGGVLSGCVAEAVSELRRMIAMGKESDEMYGEGANRRHLERERTARASSGHQVILFPPEMRLN